MAMVRPGIATSGTDHRSRATCHERHKAASLDVLLGASLAQVAAEYCRPSCIRDFGFRPEEVTVDTFRSEVARSCASWRAISAIGIAGDAARRPRAAAVDHAVDHYEAWDALLSGFRRRPRSAGAARRVLFPGPLTAHWDER
jgi:hypothetical protein